MTSLAARRTPVATLRPGARPRYLRSVAELAALTGASIRAARAYERAGTAAARRSVLADFAAVGRRTA